MGNKKKFGRRYDVLDAIRRNERASIRELCAMTGIKAESQVYMHLYQLEAEGLIWIERKKSRGIHLVDRMDRMDRRETDHRKCVSLQQGEAEKRIKAGKAGRGANALVGRTDRKLDEQTRIDEVVRKAKERELSGEAGSSVDVIRMNTSVWGVKGARVG